MIEFLRKYSRSWAAKIVIGLFAGALIATVFDNYGRGLGGANTVATVGGEDVTAADFIRRLRQRSREQNIDPRMLAASPDMRGLVLYFMVEERALAAEAERLGLDAPNWAVLEALRAHPVFQTREGAFADAQYDRALGSWGGTRREFEEELRMELAGAAVLHALEANHDAPKATTELIWRRAGEERDIAYARLSIDAVTEPGAPAEDVAKAYFDENPERFRRPERRKIRILALLPEDVADPDKVPEEDIRAVYDRDIAKYVTEERRNLQQLEFPDEAAAAAALARIGDGEALSAIAAELGVEPADMDIGYVTQRELAISNASLAEAAFAPTAKDQEAIGPVALPGGGSAIVVIAGIQPREETTFEEARKDIATVIALSNATGQLDEVRFAVEELRAQGLSFQEIADNDGFRVIEGLIDASGLDETGAPAANLPADPSLPSKAFEMKIGDEMDLVEIPGGGGFYAIEVVEITDSYLPEYAEAKEEASAAWRAMERVRLLDERAKSIRDRLVAGETFESLAGEYQIELATAVGLNRGATHPDLPPVLIAEAFKLRPSEASGKALVSEAGGGQERVIAQISEVRELDAEADADSLKAIAEDTKQKFERDLMAMFMTDVRTRQVTALDPDAAQLALLQSGLIQAAPQQ